MEWKMVGGERVLGMELCFLGAMEHRAFSVRGCCCLSCLTAMRGMGVSLLLREQLGTPRIWIGSGESMSEKRGWGNSVGRPRERCPPARLLEPLPTAFAMSPSPWPPPPPPESNSPVSGVGELREGAAPAVGWKLERLTGVLVSRFCEWTGNTSPRAISRVDRERKVSMRLHRGAPANVSSSDLTGRQEVSRISASQVSPCYDVGGLGLRVPEGLRGPTAVFIYLLELTCA